jgi:hypothetical protein
MAQDSFAPHECQSYGAWDDFKFFFNQFALHLSEWSRFCPACTRNDKIHVELERMLWFSCAPSSGIAQRFTHLVRQILTERMIVEDASFVADLLSRVCKHLHAWFAHRDALTVGDRPAAGAVLPHQHLHRRLRQGGYRLQAQDDPHPHRWTNVCPKLCILCADPHKRGLGLCTFILSLGVILCHTLRCVSSRRPRSFTRPLT